MLRYQLDSSSTHIHVEASNINNDHGKLEQSTWTKKLKISFRRTIRVPDNAKSYALPPDLGAFPLLPTNAFKSKLQASVAAKGGVFFPIYRRFPSHKHQHRLISVSTKKEAMWVSFKLTSRFIIKVYVGGVNAISGEPAMESMATNVHRRAILAGPETAWTFLQDYVVVPGQKWLDGIPTTNGIVKQFVAVSNASGYSVEAQITGVDDVGGIQFEVTPSIEELVVLQVVTLSGKKFIVEEASLCLQASFSKCQDCI